MTITVDFETPQVQVGDGISGIEISPIIIPYSIRNTEDPLQYLGGQVALTTEDNVSFSDNTAAWYEKALTKIKDMVAVSEVYVPEEPIADEEAMPEEPITDGDGTIAKEQIVDEKAAASEEPTLNEEEEAQDEQ